MNREERKKRWDMSVENEKRKKQMAKQVFNIATPIFSVLVIFLFFFGTELWIPINNCDSYYSFYLRFSVTFPIIFLLAIICFIYYKLTKRKLTFVFVVLFPFIFSIYRSHLNKYLTNIRIEKNLSVIKLGVITKKHQPHYGGIVNITYEENSKKKKWSFDTEDYPIKKLSIGDTILFVWVEKCKYIAKIYKFKPTKAELEMCKNDCYLINGKLVPVEKEKSD